MMACHESAPGREYACVGWIVWALGPGNNIGLRMRAIDKQFDAGALRTEGEQYESLAAMVARSRRKTARRRAATPTPKES